MDYTPPPYPPGCHIPSTDWLVSECFHTNAEGTAGGIDAALTPTETARTPLATRVGMIALAVPGTSLWLMVSVGDLLYFWSREWVSLMLKSRRLISRNSSWELNGMACQTMSPLLMASSNCHTNV